jgi:hypothetical protein
MGGNHTVMNSPAPEAIPPASDARCGLLRKAAGAAAIAERRGC